MVQRFQQKERQAGRLLRGSGVYSGLLAAVLSVCGANCLPAAAQQDGDRPAKSTLTVNARLVVLDVNVTDAAGKPVDGLSRSDFRVYEDGKLQTVRSFEVPGAHTLLGTMAADPHAVFDPAEPRNFGQSPATILVLDQLNTHFADSSFARRSLSDFLNAQPALLAQPTELLSLYDRHFHSVQGFTRDRDTLLRALAAEPTRYAWNLEVQKSAAYGPLERLDQSLRVLEQIAASGGRIPGRKNVIWVGGGFPSLDPTTIDGDAAQEVKDTIRHVSDALLEARVTLYAVDPQSLAPGMTEITDPSQAEFAEAVSDLGSMGAATYNADEDFDHVALLSGGRVVRGMNDVAHQIAVDYALGRQFYTLGYAPSGASTESAAFRKIKVVCLRPGTVVNTRIGYFPGGGKRQSAPEAISYDLSTAAEGTIPLTGLKVTVDRADAPGSFDVKVGTSRLSWSELEDGSSAAKVAILAVWLDAKGHMLAHTLRGMTANAKPGVSTRAEGKTAEFLFTVEPSDVAQRKAKTLRFVVRDTESGRMGSVDLPAR